MICPLLSRRALLVGSGASALVCGAVGPGFARIPSDKRLVVVILRGGMDGLSTVVPYGDPDYYRLRPNIALRPPGGDGGVLRLDPMFGLHPTLEPLLPLWEQGQLLAIHATGTPDRTRSHFDAQDTLENGTVRAKGARDGWLNRAIGALGGDGDLGLAVGRSVPLLMRGDAIVRTWAPSRLPGASELFLDLLEPLYAGDAAFADALRAARRSAGTAALAMGSKDAKPPKPSHEFTAFCETAGTLLAQPDGANLASLELGGWDTHAGQPFAIRRGLSRLADGIVTLRDALGRTWGKTIVVMMSEFGRTARENGARGTDHGTAGLVLLAGGAVNGGRVIGDWPGLAQGALFEGRDLYTTTDLRGVLKGVLGDHLGLDEHGRDMNVFPESEGIRPIQELVRGA